MSQNRFGGIGLFPHNVKDEQQTLKLMAEVQAIAGDSAIPQPYYVSIDEEEARSPSSRPSILTSQATVLPD